MQGSTSQESLAPIPAAWHVQVFKALHPSHQGSPRTSFDEVVARLIRCRVSVLRQHSCHPFQF